MTDMVGTEHVSSASRTRAVDDNWRKRIESGSNAGEWVEMEEREAV